MPSIKVLRVCTRLSKIRGGNDRRGSLHAGPIHRISFSRDASYLAASADRTAQSMRLPAVRYPEEKHRARYLGHDAPLHSVAWSHSSCSIPLLTAAADGSAKIWQRGRPDAVLYFRIGTSEATCYSSRHVVSIPSDRAIDLLPAILRVIAPSVLQVYPSIFFTWTSSFCWQSVMLMHVQIRSRSPGR